VERGKRKWKEDDGRSGRHERKRMHMLIIIKIHILIVAAHERAVYQSGKSVKYAVYKIQGVTPLLFDAYSSQDRYVKHICTVKWSKKYPVLYCMAIET
jgi:hypothetical protein